MENNSIPLGLGEKEEREVKKRRKKVSKVDENTSGLRSSVEDHNLYFR